MPILLALVLRRQMAPDKQKGNVFETFLPHKVDNGNVPITDASFNTVDVSDFGCHDGSVLKPLIEQAKAPFGLVCWMVVVFGSPDLFESDCLNSITVNWYFILATCARIGDGKES